MIIPTEGLGVRPREAVSQWRQNISGPLDMTRREDDNANA